MTSALSWIIVEPTKHLISSRNITGFCHRILVKELPFITPSAVMKALEMDFFETKPNEKDMSQEDIQFLQFLNDKTYCNDEEHGKMSLLFSVRPHLIGTHQGCHSNTAGTHRCHGFSQC